MPWVWNDLSQKFYYIIKRLMGAYVKKNCKNKINTWIMLFIILICAQDFAPQTQYIYLVIKLILANLYCIQRNVCIITGNTFSCLQPLSKHLCIQYFWSCPTSVGWKYFAAYSVWEKLYMYKIKIHKIQILTKFIIFLLLKYKLYNKIKYLLQKIKRF